jgi:replicative DNA helicase
MDNELILKQHTSNDLEKSILAASMLDRSVVPVVMRILREDSFYNEKHLIIFKAIKQLFNDGMPTDLTSVQGLIRKGGNIMAIGGTAYLCSITDDVATSASTEYHCRLLEQLAIARRLITICNNTVKDIVEGNKDIFDVVSHHQQALSSTGIVIQGNTIDAESRANEVLQVIETSRNNHGLTGITTGIKLIDDITAGHQRGDLIILAARPGMGKSAYAIFQAYKAQLNGNKCAFFCLEMSKTQIGFREAAMFSNVWIEKIKSGKLDSIDYERMKSAISEMKQHGLIVDTDSFLDVVTLRSKIYTYIQEHGIKMVIIDYLQLMWMPQNKGENRSLAVANTTRAIKLMAKDFNIPILLLSQLNREVEGRGGTKKPQLSDLKESGGIEENADQVIFLHRPEYYDAQATDAIGNSLVNRTCVTYAKNRQGRTGDIWVESLLAVNRYNNIETNNF